MKHIKIGYLFTFLMMVVLLGLSMATSSCDGSEDPSAEDDFLNDLAHTWTLTSGEVKVDGVDVTEAFAGMTITFTKEKTYSTAHGVAPIWPASGSFIINEETDGTYTLLRDDGIPVAINAVTTTSIQMTIQYTSTSGRTTGTSGLYVFTLSKN